MLGERIRATLEATDQATTDNRSHSTAQTPARLWAEVAAAFFASLSTTNKKLYVTWIESAKRAETRERRVSDVVAKLRDGQTLR